MAKLLNGQRVPNSGATVYKPGDVSGDSILIECKTLTTPQKTQTLKKEWFTKIEKEAFESGKYVSAVAFDFGQGTNYIAVREDLFAQLYAAWVNKGGT